MEKNIILEEERIDELHRNGYKLIQDPNKFCFGMDAVLLSHFAIVKEGEVSLDLGTGTGIIPILLEAKTKGRKFYALEIQQESVNMARRSVCLNKLQEKIEIIEGDIKYASSITSQYKIDVITTNPPYMNYHHGLTNDNTAKAIARHELLCSLEDVIRESATILKEKGRLYMVHRPFRMAEIISLLVSYKLEPKRIQFVHPYINKQPNMILIEAIKGAKPMVKVEQPLIVYKDIHCYTDEICKIYGYETETKGTKK